MENRARYEILKKIKAWSLFQIPWGLVTDTLGKLEGQDESQALSEPPYCPNVNMNW